jgi:hypothetical protein
LSLYTLNQADEKLTVPLMGYDNHLPLKDNLYRLLAILAIRWAKDNQLIFNLGAGASEFKQLRGGEGYIEYSAIYHGHLSLYRRQPWNILRFLMENVGIPLLNYCKF